jgi:hypothetical protein
VAVVGEQWEDEVSSTTRFEVMKFDGTGNIPIWQSRVADAVKPAKMDAEDFAEMQIKAARMIRLILSDQVLYHVIDVESPSEIWTTLEAQFQDKTAANKLYLKQELYGLKMQEGTDLLSTSMPSTVWSQTWHVLRTRWRMRTWLCSCLLRCLSPTRAWLLL